jgi:surface polysaccharide O-acyltransferase-like enzyme
MQTAPAAKPRYAYLDFLRILAAFLVIVNHTNSLIFKSLAPADTTWWLSIAWYYASKIAVPLFIMVSGACLLPRQDTYRKAVGRFFRVFIVLVLFSYLYYLVNLWQAGWEWGKALNIPAFLVAIWAKRITDSYWYLYFYLGLMVMLPFLQRLANAMRKRDLEIFMAVSFTAFALWPLVIHYVPAFSLPQYFDIPLFGVLIGLFFAGHYLHAFASERGKWGWVAVLALTLVASVALTYLETGRVAAGEKYWFMDERTQPSIFVVLGSMAVMALAKSGFARHTPRPTAAKRWVTLGGCAFGVYLLQDLIIAQTRYRFFVPLSGQINPLLAVLIWEIAVFAVALCVAWALKKLPGLRRLL